MSNVRSFPSVDSDSSFSEESSRPAPRYVSNETQTKHAIRNSRAHIARIAKQIAAEETRQRLDTIAGLMSDKLVLIRPDSSNHSVIFARYAAYSVYDALRIIDEQITDLKRQAYRVK